MSPKPVKKRVNKTVNTAREGSIQAIDRASNLVKEQASNLVDLSRKLRERARRRFGDAEEAVGEGAKKAGSAMKRLGQRMKKAS